METTMYMARKRSVRFVLSCGHAGKIKFKKDGQIERDVVTVRFFEKDAQYYLANFNTGDFVIVNAVAQTIKDRVNRTDRLEFWGLFMRKNEDRRKNKDTNQVQIRGKISSSVAYSDNYVIVNVLTYLEKSRPNSNKDSSVPKLTEKYKSITPIGIRVKGNAAELARKTYTKGTWVDVEGFIYGQKVGNPPKRVERIIAKKVSVIGNIQIQKEKEEDEKNS